MAFSSVYYSISSKVNGSVLEFLLKVGSFSHFLGDLRVLIYI